MSRLQQTYHGQPYARVEPNPRPESTLSPFRDFGFGLWVQWDINYPCTADFENLGYYFLFLGKLVYGPFLGIF
jgi:hypothetical protein